MSETPAIVAEEQAVLEAVLPRLRALQSEQAAADRALLERARAAHRAWTDARGDPAQREAFEEELAEAKRALDSHRAAHRARELPVGTPYFARMVLAEPGRRQQVLLGKVGVVERGLTICDWRDAPVSRLFYEYEEGDEYEETFGGRPREGTLATRRRVDVREGALVEVQAGEAVLRMRTDGSWAAPGSRREATEDHRLPDIVSLITREQFQVVTRPNAGVVLLRGRAGSGKTTVALHRIAYLHFQDPARFRADRMMVVMFNKALQTYISRVLPELGVPGVAVETFHGWASRMLRAAGYPTNFQSSTAPAVTRLKRHPAIAGLLAAHVDQLAEKAAAWRRERGGGEKLRQRLLDHPRDLWGLFDDDALCRAHLPADLHRLLPAARRHQALRAEAGAFDWEDAALLLRLGQLKAAREADLPCAWAGRYSHLVIDEAQDLSTVEIEVLVDAADAGRSVTIAGDPAQKILADAQFEGFEQLLGRLAGREEVRLDALAVGHRSTRPIMALALAALPAGGRSDRADPAVIAARDGEPVAWLDGEDPYALVAAELAAFRAARPHALVAVLAKARQAADTWARELGARLPDVRRAERALFSFAPGVVVSNVHQVKGLEFDGVVLVEPADFGEADRHLLHVAVTRAADRLWVVARRGRGLLGAGTGG